MLKKLKDGFENISFFHLPLFSAPGKKIIKLVEHLEIFPVRFLSTPILSGFNICSVGFRLDKCLSWQKLNVLSLEHLPIQNLS